MGHVGYNSLSALNIVFKRELFLATFHVIFVEFTNEIAFIYSYMVFYGVELCIKAKKTFKMKNIVQQTEISKRCLNTIF